jgi:plastocyanin
MLIYRDNKKTCMKKLLVVLAVLFIGILLAGCTTQPAAPVATPTPTPVPTTVAPTTVATTVAPTQVVVVIVKNVTATPTPTPTPLPDYVITFTQYGTVVPGMSARVPVGTKVTWVDADPYRDHTLQSTGSNSVQYFGSGMRPIPHDATLSIVFDKVGAYDYTSVYLPVLPGTIVVY